MTGSSFILNKESQLVMYNHRIQHNKHRRQMAKILRFSMLTVDFPEKIPYTKNISFLYGADYGIKNRLAFSRGAKIQANLAFCRDFGFIARRTYFIRQRNS